jgi:hypothetical protein
MASMRQLVRMGFRRWYERQLIESHAWLVSCFLCLIAAVSGVEMAGSADRAVKLGGLALLLAGAVLCWYCYRRYHTMLLLAERLGEEATCPTCGRYARFEVVRATPGGEHPENEDVHVIARCRHCAAQWVMPH